MKKKHIVLLTVGLFFGGLGLGVCIGLMEILIRGVLAAIGVSSIGIAAALLFWLWQSASESSSATIPHP